MSIDPTTTLIAAATKDGLLKQIYGDLAKPGVAKVGRALETVLGLGNTILLPLYLLNERSRLLVESSLESYRKKVDKIPSEKIATVPPEVGVPVVEKLMHTQDVDLRELYSSLLASASSDENRSKAHPAFVGIISNMSPDEARLLKHFKTYNRLPLLTYRLRKPSSGDFLECKDLFIPVFESTGLNFVQNLTVYLNNLQGLGLIQVDREFNMIPESVYELIEPQVQASATQNADPVYSKLDLRHGQVMISEFGRLFIEACITDGA